MKNDGSMIDTLARLIGKVVLTFTAVYFLGWLISQISAEEQNDEELV